MATRRGRDFRIEYDSDNGQTYKLRQRTFEDVATGDRLTPITPLFLARVDTSAPPVDIGRVQPRYVDACIPNTGNQSGESRLELVCPYRPTNPLLADLLREILNYSTPNFAVASISYFGEGVS